MSNEMVWQAKENAQPLDLSILLSCLTRSWLQLLGNVNNHVSAKRRAQVLSKIGPKYASLSNESWETNGRGLFGKQFEQRLKQRAETSKAISTASFVQRRKPFFPRGAPSKSSLWCSQLQDYSVFPKSVLSSFQAIQRKGRNNSTLHSCSQPLQTIEESSCWYRYVPRTFFNAHTFKTTYTKQNISFLSELAEHFKLPLGSGFCSGVQNRVSGISPPVLHSQHPCIRGPGNSRYPTETRHLQGFRTQWWRTESVHKPLTHSSQKRGMDTGQL